MLHNDVRIGMKVVPHGKTADGRSLGLRSSAVWKRAKKMKQPFLYVSKKTPAWAEGYQECVLSETYLDKDGDYFLAIDFKRYKP